MKKLYITFACLLVLGLVLGGFASAAPTSQAKPTTKIMIAGGRVGDPWYILSEALAYFINHDSDWLRATVVATPGITGSYEMGYTYPKEYIFVAELSNTLWMTKDPFGKGHKYYDKARFVGINASIPNVLATYNKNLKKPQDLIGKTVFIGRKGGAGSMDDLALLEAWGIKDRVKVNYGGVGSITTALKDGLADIGIIPFDLIYPAGFRKGVFITDLETRKPLYYMSVDPDMLDKLRKERRYAQITGRVPPGMLDPKTQPEELYYTNQAAFFAADEQMDEDIVYEVTRVMYESAGRWSTWHAQGAHMTKEFIPACPIDLKLVHPGAQKYYDKHGVKMRSLDVLLR